MSQPITWRNVEGTNPALAVRPMEAASGSINNTFDIFNKLIQQRQAVDQANVMALDEGAKQAYLDRLQQETSVDGVSAFGASAEAAAMREKLSAAARAQVRPAVEARTASLVNTQRGNERFTMEQAAEARAKQVAVDAALAAPLARSATVANTDQTRQQITESQARIRQADADERRRVQQLREQTHATRSTAYSATLEKLTKEDENTVGTDKGTQRLLATLGSTFKDKDPAALRDATAFITTALQSDKRFADLPTDVVEKIVLSRADDYATWFGGDDGSLTNYLKKNLQQALTDHAPVMAERAAKKLNLLELAQRQRILVDAAGEEVSPALAARLAAVGKVNKEAVAKSAAATDKAAEVSKTAPVPEKAAVVPTPSPWAPVTPTSIQESSKAISDEAIVSSMKTSGVLGWKTKFLQDTFPNGRPNSGARGGPENRAAARLYDQFSAELDKRAELAVANLRNTAGTR